MAFHSKIDDRFKMTEVICVIERLKRLKDLITRKIAANLSPRHKMAHFLPFWKLSDYQLRWEDAAGNS